MRETWHDLEAQGILRESDAWCWYERLGSLGRGGFGDVILAQPRPPSNGPKVAIKALRSVSLGNPCLLHLDEMSSVGGGDGMYHLKQQMSLLREIEAHLRCAKHRNLVALYAVHCNDGTSTELVTAN